MAEKDNLKEMEKGHQKVIELVSSQYKQILNSSEQAIYIYLDDHHKICNKNFSLMLGYSSPEEWAKVPGSFPELFVMKDSQMKLVENYQLAMEKFIASKMQINWKKKSGTSVKSEVILVPISFEGHNMAIHFITIIK